MYIRHKWKPWNQRHKTRAQTGKYININICIPHQKVNRKELKTKFDSGAK